MRYSFLSLVFIVFSSWPFLSNAQSMEGNKAYSPEQSIDFLREKCQLFPEETQLSIAIIQEGKIEYLGILRDGDTISLVENNNKVFEIASITKVFTATLLAQLVVNKSLSLDDSIQDFLDYRIKTPEIITLKQLANHTSGLPTLPSNMYPLFLDYNNPYKNYNEKKLKTYLTKKIKLNSEPGKQSNYSNLGSGLLGYILEKHSGKSYGELLEEYIFSQYKMTASTIDRSKIKHELIQGLNKKGKKTSFWDFDVLLGAGGIYSTVEDLSKFALTQFDNQNNTNVLTQTSTFSVSEKSSMGLGWNIVEDKDKSKKVIWHNGGTGGFTSSMALDVVNQNGVILLSNVSSFHKHSGEIDKICFGILRALQKI